MRRTFHDNNKKNSIVKFLLKLRRNGFSSVFNLKPTFALNTHNRQLSICSKNSETSSQNKLQQDRIPTHDESSDEVSQYEVSSRRNISEQSINRTKFNVLVICLSSKVIFYLLHSEFLLAYLLLLTSEHKSWQRQAHI